MAKTLIKDIAGWSFYGCGCLTEWWPLVQRMAVKRGLVKQKLDVSQGGYNAGGVAASAGTHDGGGVLDLRQYSDGVIRLLREAGSAAWHRTPAQGFVHHTHLVLVGCPHVSRGAGNQVASYRAGRNGLAMNGADDGPQVGIRTWREGAAWMRVQLGDTPLTEAPAPTPSKPTPGESNPSQEEDMATIESISDAAADKIGRAVAKHLAEATVHAAVESVSDSAANKLARTNATVSFGGAKVGEAIIEIAANTRVGDAR